jgi:hypothetical protein
MEFLLDPLVIVTILEELPEPLREVGPWVQVVFGGILFLPSLLKVPDQDPSDKKVAKSVSRP